MKKTTKPAPKTPAKKAPAIKQSAAKPKAKPSSTKPKARKASGQAELTQIVARLEAIAEKLAQTAERLSQNVLPASDMPPLPPAEVLHPHTDEHADDVEVAGVIREE
jgi:hypothetical protein